MIYIDYIMSVNDYEIMLKEELMKSCPANKTLSEICCSWIARRDMEKACW